MNEYIFDIDIGCICVIPTCHSLTAYGIPVMNPIDL